MTVNTQPLPGHETQSKEMNCPACGRFVGAVSKCPYCGAKVEKRMSLVAIRWAAVLLATIGLFLLYMMAKHREIPVVMLGNIKPTMNFGQIRVIGQVDSDARRAGSRSRSMQARAKSSELFATQAETPSSRQSSYPR